ncbi:epoxide hydrolase [Leifsonia sp. NPDC080035]|uniref:Epoxide hydrolase n=1 Tax=Leifsonia sp. NPDC080035 TaxID=3143936 RepID=A0AAU7GG01_9MICO
MQIRPFTVSVPERDLEDLSARIARTRWPEPATAPGFTQGVPLPVMREVAAYWQEGYDWRRLEAELAAIPQHIARVDGLDIHLVHARSSRTDAVPLVLTHGWPGSFLEFLDVLPLLTDPPDRGRAFHVVIPSLPGYGFSGRPEHAGWGIERIAAAWLTLMDGLGYERFVAAGGDWGTSISTMIAAQAPHRVLGLHLTPPLVAPDPATLADPTDEERAALDALERSAEGSAYSALHASRPQTLGYLLLDSPVGQAAWILEKFAAWSDIRPGETLFDVIARDRVLDDITLYWLTGTGASSTRLYAESIETVSGWFREGTDDRIDVPLGAAVYRDTPAPSRRWAERRFPDIRYWSRPERGGHFAALEQPRIYARELRASVDAILGRRATG